MALTLNPDTERRLQTVAEEQGRDPAELHEDLLRQALALMETAKPKEEPRSLADLTTAAALAGPIFDLWNTPEEDAAWEHLASYNRVTYSHSQA
jgi:hypothetical protein